ncbi:MAG: 2-oxoacid:ferredoxin oxidoreductase subunit beta [Chloroflexi bacterium]|nr:2-oxoacid:ferredoxin oxidoreductase subunit beta [Chloroflexota bacterium]
MTSASANGAIEEEIPLLTRKDFVSDQEVRWCPGCGDYSILAQMQKTLPGLRIPREEIVFVSGIGCSSRFPYYVNTYGFHTIHGRAPAIATGLKTARPELTVFVITGDGDGLSIGGNHLMHLLRRNVDVTVVLFNNRIYGLTKGQYSPTSPIGKVTKSAPMGTTEKPLDPIKLALSVGATFVARSVDRDTKHLEATLATAAKHKGAAFVEVFQNCNIYNDGAFASFADKDVRQDRMVYLEDGKPLRYGKHLEHGIRLNGFQPEAVENPMSDDELLVHDTSRDDIALPMILSGMDYPDFPVPLGIFRQVERETYDGLVAQQVDVARDRAEPDLEALIAGPETWNVL